MKDKKVNVDTVLRNYDPDFSSFFENRILQKIHCLKDDVSIDGLYDRFFKRTVFSGVAAIAAILIVIFMLNGSLGIESILGVKDLSMENSIVLSLADL